MSNTFFNFSVSSFRSRLLAVILLAAFFTSFMPVAGIAQPPTATIQSLSGAVLASGQPATVGAVLNAGDTIETQAGASVVLALSDGSILRLGENTQINLSDLTQTATGARVSWLKLLRGRIRALLSPDHQKAGSAFTIETPNAQVGVKFSQPDVEVSYDPAKQETIGIAHTVELIAINLLTNEKITVPVGTTVIIVGVLLKIATGTAASALAIESGTTAAAGSTAAGTTAITAAGLGTGTILAIGAGVAAAGGVVAVAASASGGGESTIDVSRWADCSQAHIIENSINVFDCQFSGGFTVRDGRTYWIRMSHGFPDEYGEPEARAEQQNVSLSVTMNGVPLAMDGDTVVEYNTGAGYWEVNSYHCTGTLTSGNYTIIGNTFWSTFNFTWGGTCILRVQ